MKSDPTLRVTKGNHAGATQVLDQKPFIIGSSREADIVLTDPSVFARHARVIPGSSAIELEALEGEIAVDGRTIQPGGKIQTRYPLRLALGEAELEMAAATEGAKRPIPLVAVLVGVAAVCVVVAAKVGFDAPKGGGDLAGAQSRTPAPDMTASAKLAAPDGEIAKAAAEALQEHLLALKIDTISVKPGDRTVSASGTIDPQRKDDWQSTEIWFDEKFGQRVILQPSVNAVSRKPIKAPIAIQSVWSGKFPYIIDSEGNKLFEGSTLRDGWVVEKIQEDGILISKDKQPLLLKY